MNIGMEGKVAFITGAASKRGMGHALAQRMANEGADVIVFDKFVSPKSVFDGYEEWRGLEEVVTEVEAIGRRALSLTGDISSTADVEFAVNAALEKFGKIDMLINCAGIRGSVNVPVVDGSEEEWPRMFDVNTIGCFILSKAVARDIDTKMRAEQKGVGISEFKAEEYKILDNMVPLGRMGTMDDITNLVTFLASNQSDYMTGQDINITGGFKMP